MGAGESRTHAQLEVGVGGPSMVVFGSDSDEGDQHMFRGIQVGSLLVIYNLPHALCIKRKYMMLFMMIFGPKQPGDDINVYLNPLIEDLKLLWNEGLTCLTRLRMNFSDCMRC